MHDIIKIDHLSKRFGEVQAVQDLSFRVKEGELFAVLGGIDGRIRFSFRGFVVPCFAMQRRQVSQRAQAEHT